MKLNQSEVVEYIKTNLKEFGGEMSQTDIAKHFQCSSPRICQIAKSIRGTPRVATIEATDFTNEALQCVNTEADEPYAVAIP